MKYFDHRKKLCSLLECIGLNEETLNKGDLKIDALLDGALQARYKGQDILCKAPTWEECFLIIVDRISQINKLGETDETRNTGIHEDDIQSTGG